LPLVLAHSGKLQRDIASIGDDEGCASLPRVVGKADKVNSERARPRARQNEPAQAKRRDEATGADK